MEKTSGCIACVILNFNDALLTIHIAKELEQFIIIDKIIIVDNCSTDDSWKKLQVIKSEKIDLILSELNGGYGAGNNLGVKYAYEKYNAKYTLISNPDVVFNERTVSSFKRCFEMNSKCAVVSAVQMLPSGKKCKSNWSIPKKWQCILEGDYFYSRLKKEPERMTYRKDKYDVFKIVGCVAGSLLMVDTTWFLEVGGYDEEIFLYMEETILGEKVLISDKRTYLCTTQYYLHHHGVTISKFHTLKQRRKFLWRSTYIYLKKYVGASSLHCALGRVIFACGTFEIIVAKWIIRQLDRWSVTSSN